MDYATSATGSLNSQHSYLTRHDREEGGTVKVREGEAQCSRCFFCAFSCCRWVTYVYAVCALSGPLSIAYVLCHGLSHCQPACLSICPDCLPVALFISSWTVSPISQAISWHCLLASLSRNSHSFSASRAPFSPFLLCPRVCSSQP